MPDKTGLLLRLLASWLLARCVLLLKDPLRSFHLLNSTRYVNTWVMTGLFIVFFLLLHLVKGKLKKQTDVFFFLYSFHVFSFISLLLHQEKNFAAGIFICNLLFFYLLLPIVKEADGVMGFKIMLFATGIPVLVLSLGRSPGLKVESEKLQYSLILMLISLFIAGVATWVVQKIPKDKLRFPIPVKRIGCTAVVLYVLSLCLIMVTRFVSLETPTYDFGIFAQMFHYMKDTGRPLTTLERNGLLSHFRVHLSPIYYLMLPLYLVLPNPAVLQLLQIFVMLSGIIPLVLLTKEFLFPDKWSWVFVCMYVFNPGLTGGLMYDLHENCFLAPLLLWVLYALQKERWLYVAIFSFLVLCVKEDAPVYLACIGLYATFGKESKKKTQAGPILLAVSLLWFVGALLYLEKFGQGPMIGRYHNMITDPKTGLLGIFVTIYKNPGYVLSEIFTQDKLIYMVYMLVPLGLMPLLNRKLSYWFLIVPFVVVNLLTSYPYQYNIHYQYHFGSGALLLYTALLFIKDRREGVRKSSNIGLSGLTFLVFLALAGSVLFGLDIVSKRLIVVTDYVENIEETKTVKRALDVIPEDASVQATTLLTSYLSRRDVLYDIKYNQKDDQPHVTDFVVFDLRDNEETDYQEIIEDFKDQGYDVWLYVHDHVMILHNPDYQNKGM